MSKGLIDGRQACNDGMMMGAKMGEMSGAERAVVGDIGR
jgi:hypothetical protein